MSFRCLLFLLTVFYPWERSLSQTKQLYQVFWCVSCSAASSYSCFLWSCSNSTLDEGRGRMARCWKSKHRPFSSFCPQGMGWVLRVVGVLWFILHLGSSDPSMVVQKDAQFGVTYLDSVNSLNQTIYSFNHTVSRNKVHSAEFLSLVSNISLPLSYSYPLSSIFQIVLLSVICLYLSAYLSTL